MPLYERPTSQSIEKIVLKASLTNRVDLDQSASIGVIRVNNLRSNGL